MRRRLPLFRLVSFLCLGLVGITALALWIVRVDRVVLARGRLSGGSTAVRLPAPGKILAVHVENGQQVSEGDLLLQLDVRELDQQHRESTARLESLRDEVRFLQSHCERLVQEIHPEERDRLRRGHELAELIHHQRSVRLELFERLARQGLVNELERQDAELERDQARLAEREAEKAGGLLEAQQRLQMQENDEQVQRVESQILQERLNQQELARRMELATVTAPTAGTVSTTRNLQDLVGQVLGEGDEILRITTQMAQRFEGHLLDHGRVLARPGQPVHIRLHAYPWLVHGSVPGRLESVSTAAGSDGYAVEIRIEDPAFSGPLYDGLEGDARIVIDSGVSLVELLFERVSQAVSP